MALAVLKSRALAGMEAAEVTVEVHLAGGLPTFNLVGLPDTEVKEARDRVRAAIQNCHFDFPQRRIKCSQAFFHKNEQGSCPKTLISDQLCLARRGLCWKLF